tara:strand:- start:613 stop:1236 length:624 start_codon:yes stop_codon:yes gene_type:complete
MDNYTISIFNNKIFFEIINEIKLFSKYKIKHYEDLQLCKEHAYKKSHIIVFFEKSIKSIEKNSLPIIVILENQKNDLNLSGELVEQINMPFSILEFEKKVISIISKANFRKNSLIELHGYIIDKNERKIKKDQVELQLSEKEVNFLVLFSQNNKPVSRNFVLKNVWNYSDKSETHTVETHIHRLRKKILEKFGDNNFIKNNNKGYYI